MYDAYLELNVTKSRNTLLIMIFKNIRIITYSKTSFYHYCLIELCRFTTSRSSFVGTVPSMQQRTIFLFPRIKKRPGIGLYTKVRVPVTYTNFRNKLEQVLLNRCVLKKFFLNVFKMLEHVQKNKFKSLEHVG